MVDPNKDNELTVETEARKVWVTPRLETSSIAVDTLTGPANHNDGGGAGSSVS